jgi:hypothetical protein
MFGEALRQLRVRFNGHHSGPSARQQLGHFTMPRANFQPGFAARDVQRLQYSFPPIQIGKKMLAQLLSRHRGVEFSNFTVLEPQGSS